MITPVTAAWHSAKERVVARKRVIVGDFHQPRRAAKARRSHASAADVCAGSVKSQQSHGAPRRAARQSAGMLSSVVVPVQPLGKAHVGV